MSKTRHQNGNKKNNNTSSQMLLDHCYTFGLLLWPSNSEEVVPLEKGPHWPIMALPWIHHCADLAQQSIQMCRSHEYSQMLVDNCYALSLLLQHSTLKEEVLWRRGPHWRIMAPALDLPLSGFGPIVNTNERGLENFIRTKFGEYPSSDSVVKSDYVFPIHIHALVHPPPFSP